MEDTLQALDDAEMAPLLQAVDDNALKPCTESSSSLSCAQDDATLEDCLGLDMLLRDVSTILPASIARKTTTERATQSRQRQSEELEYLRGQVRELGDQLDELKQAVRGPSESPSSQCEVGIHQPAPHTWERIARHQRSAKQKAEAENVRLREVLEGQLKIARGLEKLLHKRTSGEVVELVEESKRRRRADSTDAQVYEQLARHLDMRYAEWEPAFTENGLASRLSDVEDTRVSEDVAGAPMVEILFAKVLPFDLTRTSDAVWKCSTTSYLQLSSGFYAAQPLSDGLVKAQFEIPMQVRRQSVTLHVHVAMKKFQEPTNREVYVWESISVTRCSQSSYNGITLNDHGWTVIQELPTKDPQKASTIVQCCSQFMPETSTMRSTSPIGVLSDVMIASYNRNYQTLCETVETLLLERILGIRQEPKVG